MGEKAGAHSLFRLTVTNDGHIPNQNIHQTQSYFLGLKVLSVGMLIAEESNQVLDKKTSDKATQYCRIDSNLAIL